MSPAHAQVAYIETVMDLFHSEDGLVCGEEGTKKAQFISGYRDWKRGMRQKQKQAQSANVLSRTKSSSPAAQMTRSTGSLVSVSLDDKPRESNRHLAFSYSADQQDSDDHDHGHGHGHGPEQDDTRNDSETDEENAKGDDNDHTISESSRDTENEEEEDEDEEEEEGEQSHHQVLDSEMDLYDSENMDESEDSDVDEDPLHVKEPFEAESSASPLSILSGSHNLTLLPGSTHPLAATLSVDHQGSSSYTFSSPSIEEQLKLALARIEMLEKKLNVALAHNSRPPVKNRLGPFHLSHRAKTLLTILNASFFLCLFVVFYIYPVCFHALL